MTLRSAEFDDVYFSAEDGLAETTYVFLDGNGLPAAWEGRPRFTIAETGFGTGLNFLAAWSLFERTAQAGQRLDYVSVERYPLTPAQIGGALARWEAAFGGRLARLLAAWPLPVPGFHRLAFGRVTLTLIFDDVMDALPQIVAPAGVDAWFLDGFAPKKNPQMWTPQVFAQMARLGHAETTYSTFTAKGAVRRALAEAGFTAERIDGYGSKWHMTRGRFVAGAPRPPDIEASASVAIIGGGLAGTAAAFMLRRAGITATVFESGAALATAASGNALGLVNPRLSARRTAQSDYHAAGFAAATRLLATLPDVGWRPCGSLHLATNENRDRQLRGAKAHWGWPDTQLAYMDAAAAADKSGLPAGVLSALNAAWLPAAGTVSPARLCLALVGDTPVRTNAEATPTLTDGGWQVGGEFFQALVIAGGDRGRGLVPALPLRPVRGQLTEIAAASPLSVLNCALCYGGYAAPARDGGQWIGATFQRGETDCAPRTTDDFENIAKLAAVLPGLAAPRVISSRAGVRVAAPDHFPFVGRLAGNAAPLYATIAHGSHGIISALAAGQYLADLMGGGVRSLSGATSAALSPERFAATERRASPATGQGRTDRLQLQVAAAGEQAGLVSSRRVRADREDHEIWRLERLIDL